MLTLNGVAIYLQNFGTVTAVFLTASDKEAIEQRFNSFWNHQATGGEYEWWSDTTLLFWVWGNERRTADAKMLKAMEHGALAEILNKSGSSTKGSNPMINARQIAKERFKLIGWVNWLQVNPARELNIYDMGDSVKAEKETGDFSDVLGSIVEGSAGHKGLTDDKEMELEDIAA